MAPVQGEKLDEWSSHRDDGLELQVLGWQFAQFRTSLCL